MGKKLSHKIAFNRYLKKRLSPGFQQRMALLLKREEKKIRAFRKEWHIPVITGFTKKEDWQYWWENLKKIVPQKVKNIKYKEIETFYIFDKFTPNKIIYSSEIEKSQRITVIDNDPKAVFDFEINKLIAELKLDHDFHDMIRDYIWFNKAFIESVKNTGIIVSERIVQEISGQEIERRISLIFGPNTDEEDLKTIYKLFVDDLQKAVQGYLKGKIQPQDQLERNLKIIELYNQGKSEVEIQHKLENEEIWIDLDYIHKIIKRIRAY